MMSYGIADEYKMSNFCAECDCSVAKLSKMFVHNVLYLILGIMLSTNQGKGHSYNVYSHLTFLYTCSTCYSMSGASIRVCLSS